MEIFTTTVNEKPSYRILQAEILIAKQIRTRAGMKLLRELKVSALTEKQKSVVEKLALQARAAIDNGEIEVGE